MKKLVVAATLLGLLVLSAAVRFPAGHDGRFGSDAGTSEAPLPAPDAERAAPAAAYSKVLVIVDENKTFTRLITENGAPYLARLAKTFGVATGMDAGYPARCPSLAAYIIMTSGSDHGICDDKDPVAHPLAGPSVFSQVAAAGKEWKVYAEDMPTNCAKEDHGLFAVRHVPSNYYTDLRQQCLRQSVPMGTLTSGALHDDVAAGTLPELSFVIPNLCNDMHHAEECPSAVPTGDRWLSKAVPALLGAPDYSAGRLAVFIAFDEGTSTDNHIPFVVLSPRTAGVTVSQATNLCSILATMSQLLRIDPLGCAAQAESLASDFRLAGQ